MNNRKFGQYNSVFSIVAKEFAVPTAIGTAILLLTQIPKILKTAKEIKTNIPNIQNMINDLIPQTVVEQPHEMDSASKVINVQEIINDAPVTEVETSTENTTEEVPNMG